MKSLSLTNNFTSLKPTTEDYVLLVLDGPTLNNLNFLKDFCGAIRVKHLFILTSDSSTALYCRKNNLAITFDFDVDAEFKSPILYKYVVYPFLYMQPVVKQQALFESFRRSIQHSMVVNISPEEINSTYAFKKIYYNSIRTINPINCGSFVSVKVLPNGV